MKMPPSLSGSLKGKSLSPEIGKRVTSAVLIMSCLVLVSWSLTARLSLVTEAQSQIHIPFSIGLQVESLEQLWSDDEAQVVHQEWGELKSHSFSDYDHLLIWVSKVTGYAHGLGLTVSYRVDDTSTPIQDAKEIHRIGMEWTIQAENPDEAYPSFVQFIRSLSEDAMKINFEFIEVTGSGQGAQKMELRLHTFLQQAA